MSTIDDMGIPEVSNTILQPKLQNRWRVTFTNMGGGADSRPVSAQATNISRPNLSFSEVELHRYNSRAYVPGKHEWDSLSLTVEDDVTSTASTVIREQIQAQQWLTGVEGAWLSAAPEGSILKFTTQLDMLDGGENILERWIYQGCWLQNVDYGSLDYSTSEATTIDCTIRFDHAYQDMLTYTSGPGTAIG